MENKNNKCPICDNELKLIKTSNYKYILDNFPDIKTIDINKYIIL